MKKALATRVPTLWIVILITIACTHPSQAQWPAPTILAPTQNSQNQSVTPTVRWTSVLGLAYTVQVSEHSDFSTLVISMNVKATSKNSSMILGGLDYKTTYYVRIRAGGSGFTSSWSQTLVFTTINESSVLPMVVSPKNGAVAQPTRPMLAWQAFPDAMSYDLEVSPTVQFSVLAFRAQGIVQTQAQSSLLSPLFTYYWRVRANTESATTEWSTTSSFQTGETPASPLLLTPEPETILHTRTVDLVWNACSTATAYHVQVARNSTFQDLLMDDDNVNVTHVMVTIPTDSLIFWRVSALNAIGEGTWSAWRTMHASTELSIDGPAQLLSITVTPNPAASLATFRYTVPAPGQVSLVVRDLQGVEVLRNVQPHTIVGTYDTPLDISALALGVYVYEVSYNNHTDQGRIMIIR